MSDPAMLDPAAEGDRGHPARAGRVPGRIRPRGELAPATQPCAAQGWCSPGLSGQAAVLRYVATLRYQGADAVVLIYARSGGWTAVVMRSAGAVVCSCCRRSEERRSSRDRRRGARIGSLSWRNRCPLPRRPTLTGRSMPSTGSRRSSRWSGTRRPSRSPRSPGPSSTAYVAGALAVLALILLVIGLFRLHVYLPFPTGRAGVYATYLVVGAIFVVGRDVPRRRRAPRTKE